MHFKAFIDPLLRIAVCQEADKHPFTVSLVCPLDTTSADRLYYSRLYSDELVSALTEEMRNAATKEEESG